MHLQTQRHYRVAYQGGRGSNSERAGTTLLAERFTGWPFASFADAAAALASGHADLLLLPIHNSSTGVIAEAAALARNFKTLEHTTLRIDHYLLGVPGARRKDITEVWAHPQVAAQCRGWLSHNSVRLRLVDDGARQAPAFLRGGLRHVGVLGPVGIGKATGLYCVEGPVQDEADNRTTLALLCRERTDDLQPSPALAGGAEWDERP
ncbi:MAG: hypothetical protein KF696_11740 [Planctomycetes bacterium]|nr:hypothetical protein [Planctomycetota bacterium]MCW8136960.1 hypothetical protein [Planctomycetota bacterium]